MSAEQDMIYKVREGFAVGTPSGIPEGYPPGRLVRGSDPIAKTHAHLLEPALDAVIEDASAAPGARRSLRLPGGRTVGGATAHHTGHAHGEPSTAGDNMAPHRNSLDPSDPNSPASAFAPAQPAAGVVAPDVPAEQNLAGAPKPEEVSEEKVQAFVDTASDPTEGAGPVPDGQNDPSSQGDPGELKGAALDEALKEAGLGTSGTVAEKRARLAESQQSGS